MPRGRPEDYLLGMPSPGYGGGYEPSRGYGTLQSLLMERGRLQAEAAERSGALWANALGNLGQNISGAITQHQEAKKKKTRDDAYLAIMNDPKALEDPMYARQQFLKVGGPEDGARMFQGFAGGLQLLQPNRDPEKDQKGAAAAIKGLRSIQDVEKRAGVWAQLSPPARKVFGDKLPQEYDDDVFNKVLLPWAESLEGPQAPIKVGKGETLLDPTTKQPIYEPPPDPPKPAEPRGEPKEPKLVPQKTVNAAGQEVIKWVTPQPGEEFVQPTGQGKASTGQQKRALNFFNRGKEAGEIADGLEDRIIQYGPIDKARLGYEGPFSNFAKSGEMQRYRQAQRAFTEARLRKDSGAQVPDAEYENDEITYFWQPGDTAETLAQKRAQRNEILASVGFEAGDALREFYGAEAEGMLEGFRGKSKGSKPNKVGRFTVEVE